MSKIQTDLTRIAKELLIRTDAEHNASVADILTEFATGTYVLAAPGSTRATRMHTQWTGRYKVSSSQKGQYMLLDLFTTKTKKMYHVTQLKPFHSNQGKVDPVDIARRDNLEHLSRIFSVSKVILNVLLHYVFMLNGWDMMNHTIHGSDGGI